MFYMMRCSLIMNKAKKRMNPDGLEGGEWRLKLRPDAVRSWPNGTQRQQRAYAKQARNR